MLLLSSADLTKNLHGLSLTVVFSKLSGNPGGPGLMFYSNPAWKLLLTIGQLMNFSINSRVHFYPVRYTPDENGKLGGYIDKVNELELAIGTGIAPNILISDYIETTRAYSRNQIGMLMKTQTKIISMASVLSIIDEIFQGIIFIFLVLIATLLAIDNLTIWRKEGRHCDSLITNITKEYKKVLFVLAEISYLKISLETFQRFRRFPARILLYTWWFFSILIISFHQATLTSKLVIPVAEPEVQQVSDLYNENRSEFKDWQAGVNGDRHMVEETTPPEVQKRLVVKKTELHESLGVLALPKHFPFAESIDRRLEYLIQSGLLTNWEQQHKRTFYSLLVFVQKRALKEQNIVSWEKDYIVEKQSTIVTYVRCARVIRNVHILRGFCLIVGAKCEVN
ncbi:unnamed protein product [Allacma fusca]|uniref:Ionotropic glutamate receptor C-terminal domain-containing protein n=1 Tax=Allacma fusca TaxID=39272 RepID=A0A8J2KLB7_9HEXA|nr:unnamed protein product [Allacma fusca]